MAESSSIVDNVTSKSAAFYYESFLHLLLFATLVISEDSGHLTFLMAGLIFINGTITIRFCFLLTKSLEEGGVPAYEKNSTLGGVAGGWHLSKTMTYLLFTIIFGFITLTFSVMAIEKQKEILKMNQKIEQVADEEKTDSTKTKTTPPPKDSTDKKEMEPKDTTQKDSTGNSF